MNAFYVLHTHYHDTLVSLHTCPVCKGYPYVQYTVQIASKWNINLISFCWNMVILYPVKATLYKLSKFIDNLFENRVG